MPSVSSFVSLQNTLRSARLIKAITTFPIVPTFALRPSRDHCTLNTINAAKSKNGLMYSGSMGKRNTVARSQRHAGLSCRWLICCIESIILRLRYTAQNHTVSKDRITDPRKIYKADLYSQNTTHIILHFNCVFNKNIFLLKIFIFRSCFVIEITALLVYNKLYFIL